MQIAHPCHGTHHRSLKLVTSCFKIIFDANTLFPKGPKMWPEYLYIDRALHDHMVHSGKRSPEEVRHPLSIFPTEVYFGTEYIDIYSACIFTCHSFHKVEYSGIASARMTILAYTTHWEHNRETRFTGRWGQGRSSVSSQVKAPACKLGLFSYTSGHT